ncbi:MAG: hypothetical protein R3C26_11820 [Calditrichia bacterium]
MPLIIGGAESDAVGCGDAISPVWETAAISHRLVCRKMAQNLNSGYQRQSVSASTAFKFCEI